MVLMVCEKITPGQGHLWLEVLQGFALLGFLEIQHRQFS